MQLGTRRVWLGGGLALHYALGTIPIAELKRTYHWRLLNNEPHGKSSDSGSSIAEEPGLVRRSSNCPVRGYTANSAKRSASTKHRTLHRPWRYLKQWNNEGLLKLIRPCPRVFTYLTTALPVAGVGSLQTTWSHSRCTCGTCSLPWIWCGDACLPEYEDAWRGLDKAGAERRAALRLPPRPPCCCARRCRRRTSCPSESCGIRASWRSPSWWCDAAEAAPRSSWRWWSDPSALQTRTSCSPAPSCPRRIGSASCSVLFACSATKHQVLIYGIG